MIFRERWLEEEGERNVNWEKRESRKKQVWMAFEELGLNPYFKFQS